MVSSTCYQWREEQVEGRGCEGGDDQSNAVCDTHRYSNLPPAKCDHQGVHKGGNNTGDNWAEAVDPGNDCGGCAQIQQELGKQHAEVETGESHHTLKLQAKQKRVNMDTV